MFAAVAMFVNLRDPIMGLFCYQYFVQSRMAMELLQIFPVLEMVVLIIESIQNFLVLEH